MTFTATPSNIMKPKFTIGSENATDEKLALTNEMFRLGLLQYDLATGRLSLSSSVNHNNSLN